MDDPDILKEVISIGKGVASIESGQKAQAEEISEIKKHSQEAAKQMGELSKEFASYKTMQKNHGRDLEKIETVVTKHQSRFDQMDGASKAVKATKSFFRWPTAKEWAVIIGGVISTAVIAIVNAFKETS